MLNANVFKFTLTPQLNIFSTSKKDHAFFARKSSYYAVWCMPLILRSYIYIIQSYRYFTLLYMLNDCLWIPQADWPEVVIRWAPFERQKDEVHIFYRADLSGFARLVIFPMSGNNIFETSDFTDPQFSFCSSEGALLSPMDRVLMEKIYCETWNKWFCVFSLKSFSFTCFLTSENSKSK